MNYIDMSLKELEAYTPVQTKAADFNDFWEKTAGLSKSQPLNVQYDPVDYPVKQVRIFEVWYDGFLNSRIHGKLIMPSNASKTNKVPAVVVYHGYNWNDNVITGVLKYNMLGYAVFLAEVRGQNVKTPDHNKYDNGGSAGWMTLGVLDPENYYYRYVFMDCARVIDLLLGRGDIDPGRMAVTGISQGGGLSLAIGALCPEVSVVMADVPFLCHFRRAVQIATSMPYLEFSHYFRMQDPLHRSEEQVYNTLSYFDNLNLSSKIRGDVLMSVGLEDVCCPASTSFAAYNHIGAYKEIRVYPDYGHGGFTQQEEEKFAFIAKRFGTV